jgi:hypothetical protein
MRTVSGPRSPSRTDLNIELTGSQNIRLRVEEAEVLLLRGLLDEMRALLKGDDRTDPVLDRLFPAAFEEPEEAAAYRDLTETELRNAKLAAIETVRSSLDGEGNLEIMLDPDDAEEWLRLLNDIRLAIGARIDVTEEKMSAEPDPADPNSPALHILHWLGWVQESMLDKLSSSTSG